MTGSDKSKGRLKGGLCYGEISLFPALGSMELGPAFFLGFGDPGAGGSAHVARTALGRFFTRSGTFELSPARFLCRADSFNSCCTDLPFSALIRYRIAYGGTL